MHLVTKLSSVFIMLMLSLAGAPAAAAPMTSMTAHTGDGASAGQATGMCTSCMIPVGRPETLAEGQDGNRVSGIRRIYPKNVLVHPNRVTEGKAYHFLRASSPAPIFARVGNGNRQIIFALITTLLGTRGALCPVIP